MKYAVQPSMLRFAGYLGFWFVLDGVTIAGLLIGLGAAALATWTSLRLFPPSRNRWNVLRLLSLAGYFLWSSVISGVDAAVRALHPRMPLRTGFVSYKSKLPTGPTRDLFLGMSSLMPGSLPVEESEDGQIVVHCLDTEQPVAHQMTDLEGRLVDALAGAGRRGVGRRPAALATSAPKHSKRRYCSLGRRDIAHRDGVRSGYCKGRRHIEAMDGCVSCDSHDRPSSDSSDAGRKLKTR
jgi:multicomponent Na+:H+ antiporter subunit E